MRNYPGRKGRWLMWIMVLLLLGSLYLFYLVTGGDWHSLVSAFQRGTPGGDPISNMVASLSNMGSGIRDSFSEIFR